MPQVVMRQRRCRVQADQEVADRCQHLVQRLDLPGQRFVRRHQRRQRCADGRSRSAVNQCMPMTTLPNALPVFFQIIVFPEIQSQLFRIRRLVRAR
jgi:hypothetical protein